MLETIEKDAIKTLMKYGILSNEKEIDTNLVNYISIKHAPALVNAITDKHGENDMVASYHSLNDFHVKQQFDELIECCTTQYAIAGIEMPAEIRAVLDYGDRDLLEVFFYEFISDIEEEVKDMIEV